MSVETIHTIVSDLLKDRRILETLKSGDRVDVKGLQGSLKAFFLSALSRGAKPPLLAILPDYEEAESLADELAAFFADGEVAFFPGGEEDPESPVVLNPHRVGLQERTLRDLASDRLKIVVAPPSGVAMRVPSKSTLKDSFIHLQRGAQYDLYDLVQKLVRYGYIRESVAEKPGEISLRGGILDVFPYTGEAPCRVEFFGDRIETMRSFDVATQRSTESRDALSLVSSSLTWRGENHSLASYFTEDAIVYWEDPDRIFAEVEKEVQKGARCFPTDEIEDHFFHLSSLVHHTLVSPKEAIEIRSQPLPSLGRTISEIRKRIVSFCESRQYVLLFSDTEDRIDRVQEFLGLEEEPILGLRVIAGTLRQGFDLSESGLVVISEADLFGRKGGRTRRKRWRTGVPIRELSSLEKNDYVVHIDYGIGKYSGLEKISVKGAERECLTIGYRDGDKVYVPVDKMERVQKYAGSRGHQPGLSKLGTGKWEKIKEKTKKSIRDVTRDLLNLYSARKVESGYAFSTDTSWQRELEASFIYGETPDQAKAIEDVKGDMERPIPMDRLVCGDVGYGKTEVAVRAAFKAVSDSKQVAVLAPTTILAQQHLQTFQSRLLRFPVEIEVLSRFRSRKEQEDIVERLKRGEVDIVIGTHRLLSKDVAFKDLGLLIIDEEHRFGVRHKERLKAMKKTVDVMALTATPIPRTLQFSLAGIRDTSIINTPPKDRLPIITEVALFDEAVIVEAVERELARGGQVFFVHNRIQSIHAMARMIQKIMPGIRLAVAHGRMEGKELERVMVDFVDKKYECLVSTMIIESGLDMPNVNTLIVHRADRLGLAQLYQLRGRVGRADKRAYAYLLVPPLHLLTPDAVKRLRTIEEFTELGSGFQVALRDLEIRGAGNLLGVQQSGYMDAVGFDLYNKLVEEAIDELKKEEMKSVKESQSKVACVVDIDLSAYFPETYIEDESLRINLYRRLSMLQDVHGVEDMKEELRDRFGAPPQEVEDLLHIAELRLMAQEKGFKRIIVDGRSLFFYFDEAWVNRFPEPELFSERLRSMMASSPVPIRFVPKKKFGIHVSVPEGDAISFTRNLLQRWG